MELKHLETIQSKTSLASYFRTELFVDTETGIEYFVTNDGSMCPRLNRDGRPYNYYRDGQNR